ncbi:MAG: ATP-binding protein [Chloroflexales bacterium]
MSQDASWPVDLTNCDREPIHIPGTIQPHGVLLALTEPDWRIVQCSANSFAYFARHPGELLGQPLSTLLNPNDLTTLNATLTSEQVEANPLYTLTVSSGGQRFDLIAHRSNGMLIIEFEPATQSEQASSLRVYRMVKNVVTACQRTTSVRTFAQTLVAAVRKLTGFDRVMLYQFQPDASGHVIAEEVRSDLTPYLDLHYPASDIPQQARALYLRSWLRLIPDVTYEPVPLVAVDPADPSIPLDLSYAALRSVSPIHVAYLKNMGASASMSISLLKNGQLWGLVACHHHSGPCYLQYDLRAACEFLGHVVSLQIVEKEIMEDAAYTIALQAVLAQLVQQMSVANDVVVGLTRDQPNLSQYIEAGGVAVCLDGQCVLLGTTPPESALGPLLDWLTQTVPDDLFITNTLPQQYPAMLPLKASASGLLALRLARTRPNYILWFRPEVLQTVNWGGNPTKPVEFTADGAILSPRRSFALWEETVAATSLPWRSSEVLAARELRRAIIDLVLFKVDELARLNDELMRSNVELDSFAYVASHDLKEPLRGLHNYAHFLIEDYGDIIDAEGQAKLATLVRLTQRMEALIDTLLHYSRVGRAELARAEVDLEGELADVVNLLGPRIQEGGVEVRIPRPLPRIHVDQARVREVFSNLITNAIKYNDHALRWVELGYVVLPPDAEVPATEPYVFYVRDNGIGIPEEHQETIFRIFKRLHGRDEYGGGVGAGLTIVKKIVERHGGAIWLTSQMGEGTTFWFTFAKLIVDRQRLGV